MRYAPLAGFIGCLALAACGDHTTIVLQLFLASSPPSAGGAGGSGGVGGSTSTTSATTTAGTGGATTTATTSGNGGQGGEGGTVVQGEGGAGGSPVTCAVVDNCPGVDDDCKARTCNAGVCGWTFAPAWKLLAFQTKGDCAVQACDGEGNQVSVWDGSDVEDDAKDCTIDACVPGTGATHKPRPAGEPCGQNGGKVCNGASACVGCIAASDCGLPTDYYACILGACHLPTCNDGIRDGYESDIDCGGEGKGSSCPFCPNGKKCNTDVDCAVGACVGGICG